MNGFEMRRSLGRTHLQVSPLGIGGGLGISSKDMLYAFERGINYFFFSADLHHHAYQHSSAALRTLCGQGSSVRDKVVLSTVTYIDDSAKLYAILYDQFIELGIDHIDVFHWGWITDDSDVEKLIRAAHLLKRKSSYTQFIREMQIMGSIAQERNEQAMQINEDLLKRGLVRYTGASFHSRNAARHWMRNLDVMMLRYNLLHLGIEQDVIPFLYDDKTRDPGIVVFNVAHEGSRSFHIPPPGYPANQYVPSIPDCYRFALTNSWVDLVLTGLNSHSEIDLALDALEKGPLTEDEQHAIREYAAYLSEGMLQPAALDNV